MEANGLEIRSTESKLVPQENIEKEVIGKIRCAYDELADISKLIPNPKNPNKHTDDQIKRLAEIIDYTGMRRPIAVSNRSGFMTCGHGRLLALMLLGWTKAPVSFQDYDDEAQEYADMTADNAIAEWAELDLGKINLDIQEVGPFDIKMLGFKDFVVEPMEKFEPQTDEDEVPEVKGEPVTKRGDVWLLGDHRVMCGDSTMIDDVERLMNGEKADMLYTDPPYGIKIVTNNQVGGGGAFGTGKAEKSKGKHIAANKYSEIIGDESTDAAVAMIQIKHTLECKTEIIWGGNYYASYLDDSNCWIVWDKETGESTFADAELAWTNQETKVRIFKHRWSGMVKASEHGQKRVHPTQKPIALAEWCMETYNNPLSVVDLFLGSGSTLIACEKTNRKCYGIELDEKYCDVIINRWQEYTGKEAMLESNGKKFNELKDV